MLSLGGWSGAAPTSVVEVYDQRADRWFQFPAASPDFLRAYHGTVVIGMKIYILGGSDGRRWYNTTHVLDAENLDEGWTTLSCMNRARCYLASCVYNGDIWTFGGMDDRNFRLQIVERFLL